MKVLTSLKTVCLLMLMLFMLYSSQASAGQQKRGITGDWEIKMDFNDREVTSILSFSQDKEGKLEGKWIAFWGVNELNNLKYEENKLSFTHVSRFGDNEITSNFAGAIQRGKLSGTLSNDRGDFEVGGKRLRQMPMIMGSWEMKFKVGEREVTTTLVVKADEAGKPAALWQSQWGEHQISDIIFKKGKLTFQRKSKFQDQEFDSTFEGTLKAHKLSGVIKSERGDIAVEGTRVGAALVGQWDLEISSDSGSRKQLLRVNPDLSAMLGPIAVKKVNLEDNEVAFKTELEFGDQKYDISFAGNLDGRKLSGELSSSRGTQQVTGKKIRSTSAAKKSIQIKKKFRKPDILYVPTPQEVVDKMLEMAEIKEGDVVYDLGCGDGRIVVTAAKRYGVKAVGFDINPKRVRESLENVRKNNVEHLVTIKHEDVFTLDLREANVVTLYLLPSLNVKLMPQLEKLRPGSRIVSHDFDMRGAKPVEVYRMNSSGDDDGEYYGEEQHTIYKWIVPWEKE
ncbi:MAG: methyltransferase domain-containing protein [Sedimentisphaerales bacterium]|nr:methyltransferase domain-containing protein [Sedimentisphaerales bacterium]